jgi:hypothetical protein
MPPSNKTDADGVTVAVALTLKLARIARALVRGAPTATATAYGRWLQRILGHCALAESGLDKLRSDYQRAMGILPLFGRRRGFDRCDGSFDCVVYGLTNSGLLKRGSSEASGEAKMEINKPIRMRGRVRNWWPPWW